MAKENRLLTNTYIMSIVFLYKIATFFSFFLALLLDILKWLIHTG